MQRLRRILGMGGPQLRGPEPSQGPGYPRSFPSIHGAVVKDTTPTEWDSTPKFTRGGKGMTLPWGKPHDLGPRYNPQDRDTLSLRSTLNPAGRELPMAHPFDDGAAGMKRDTFTATVHSPNDRSIYSGNRSASGAKFIVHGQANVAGNASERVTTVSTPKRAEMAAKAMANRVAKTGDANVRPVKASTKKPSGGRVGKGKGVAAPSQGMIALDKREKKKAEGW